MAGGSAAFYETVALVPGHGAIGFHPRSLRTERFWMCAERLIRCTERMCYAFRVQ